MPSSSSLENRLAPAPLSSSSLYFNGRKSCGSPLPFFTSSVSTCVYSHDYPSRAPAQLLRVSNQYLSPVFSTIDHCFHAFYKTIFKPTYRRKVTNFVFVGAFVSACFCVGGQSLFPNARFHTNFLCFGPRTKAAAEQNLNLDGTSDRSAQDAQHQSMNKSSIFCPMTILQSLNLMETTDPTEAQSQRQLRQRRWLQEKTP